METLRQIFGYAEDDNSITDAELETQRAEWISVLLEPMRWKRPVEIH